MTIDIFIFFRKIVFFNVSIKVSIVKKIYMGYSNFYYALLHLKEGCDFYMF